MNYIWIEIKKFLENNIVKILIGTLLIALLFVGSSYLSSNKSVKPDDETTETTKESENVDDSEDELVDFYPETEPANFYYFVETADDAPFTNNLLIEQYITSPEVLKEATEETGTNLNEIVERTGNRILVDYSESGESHVIGIRKNGNTHLQEFQVNVGDETANLDIANYFFDYITSSEIPILKDKNLYVFQKPQIKEISTSSSFDDGSDEVVANEYNVVKEAIVGLILGGVFTTGLLIILTLFSKKLIYSFSYTINAEDYFLLVDDKLDYQDEVNQLLLKPSDSNIVVLNEGKNELYSKFFSQTIANNDIEEYNSFVKISNIQNIDRLVYVISENETTRSWYNKQRRMERSYDIPVVVLQLNSN